MKKNHFPTRAAIAALALAVGMVIACNDSKTATEETAGTSATTAVTNSNASIAPVEYAELAEKALQLLAHFEFDAWAETMADDVVYTFPDGDVDTRTTLTGKAAVVAWWKSWKEKSGIESMTMTEFNHNPINHTGPLKAGAPSGIYDIAYVSNKMIFSGKPVALRMNFAIHFNADKKIDRYVSYYDRSEIVKAMGRNMLEEMKAK